MKQHRSYPSVSQKSTASSEQSAAKRLKTATQLGLFHGIIVKSVWSLVYLVALAFCFNSTTERWQAAFTFLFTTILFQLSYLHLWLNPFVYLNSLPFFMHCLGFIAIYRYLSSIAIYRFRLIKPEPVSLNLAMILLIVFLAFIVSSIEFIMISPALEIFKPQSTVGFLTSGSNSLIMVIYIGCFIIARISIVSTIFVLLNLALKQTSVHARQIASAMILGLIGGIMLLIPQWLI